MDKAPVHTFHIPVMGIGFSIDTALKTALFGIDSVMSLVDDKLLEKLRFFYAEKYDQPYTEISTKEEDFRAKRITAWLNLVQYIIDVEFEAVKADVATAGPKAEKYFSLLPDGAELKNTFAKYKASLPAGDAGLLEILMQGIRKGSPDVNIMTKLDKPNYADKVQLPMEYNDAHAALRGFAQSNLHSSVVFSAGMNPRLYTYVAQFPDFFPDANGLVRKKIILKVSDYRSALVQGKMFAKKGLWVSEYRIESGLNCGGHAFASDGYLLGPILEEFRLNKDTLLQELKAMYLDALQKENRTLPTQEANMIVTVQGGVGTASEHRFLLDYYRVASVGWGSPFLLVPEVTNVEDETLHLLCKATEKDVFLSDVSPLGVPFNSLHGNSMELDRLEKISEGKPGSPCPKSYLTFNTEFSERPICTASRQFQKLKIAELQAQNLPQEEYKQAFDAIVEKECICSGLGTGVMIKHGIPMQKSEEKVSVCPGPNIAYFSNICTLSEMVDHIYGRMNLLNDTYRPHMFTKELELYIEYLKRLVRETTEPVQAKQAAYLALFKQNIQNGIEYYKKLLPEMKNESEKILASFKNDLSVLENKLRAVTWAFTVPAE